MAHFCFLAQIHISVRQGAARWHLQIRFSTKKEHVPLCVFVVICVSCSYFGTEFT